MNSLFLFNCKIEMDINKQIKYWRDSAEEDISTAEILANKDRFLHALFFCHLSIEKIIKAHVVKSTNEIPPKSHNLFLLSEKAKL